MNEVKKILLVEDDQNAQNFYRELLTNEGYKVDLAEDGIQGLKKIQEGGTSLYFWTSFSPEWTENKFCKD